VRSACTVQFSVATKFRWNNDTIQLAKERIADFTEHVHPLETVKAIKEDDTDNRILECAQVAKSDYIVSGNKHLLTLGQFAGMKIIKPADFVDGYKLLPSRNR
jgi:predicted nucleic acid-binding protein